MPLMLARWLLLLRRCRRLRNRLRLRRLTLRLSLRRALLAVLVFAAAPAAPMPLRLHLAIGRGWPQISLGLRRICRHACTSWRYAVWYFVLLDRTRVKVPFSRFSNAVSLEEETTERE